MARTTPPAPRVFLTVQETADLLNVSVATIRRLQQRHELPYFKVSGSVRFDMADVEAYLAAGRIEAVDAWDL